MRKLTDITDDELDDLRDALGFWDKGEGVLTREEFIDYFVLYKYLLPFNMAVKAYKWLIVNKNNFDI